MQHPMQPLPPHPNTNHTSNQLKNQPTAIKQQSNTLLQDLTIQIPRLTAFTPTRPQSTLQNAAQTNYHQENIFTTTHKKPTNPQRTKILTQVLGRIRSLQYRVSKLERTQQKINKAKRNRRRNVQLNKNHHCHVKNCQKKYESETALKKHIRTKHVNESIVQEKQQKE